VRNVSIECVREREIERAEERERMGEEREGERERGGRGGRERGREGGEREKQREMPKETELQSAKGVFTWRCTPYRGTSPKRNSAPPRTLQ